MLSAGYVLAWEELTARYDNKRVLLAAHMRALLISPPANKTLVPEIKRLITVVNQASRSFKSLERQVDQWGDWFVHLLVEKLDASTRLLWESSLNSTQDFPRFGKLIDFLQNRVRRLETTSVRNRFITFVEEAQQKIGRACSRDCGIFGLMGLTKDVPALSRAARSPGVREI